MAVPVAKLVDGNALVPIDYDHLLGARGPVLAWIPAYDRGFVEGPRYDTPCGVEDSELTDLLPSAAISARCLDPLASFLPAYYRPARNLDGRLYPLGLR